MLKLKRKKARKKKAKKKPLNKQRFGIENMMFILVYCFNKVIDCFFETPVDFLLKNSRMKKSDMYLTFLHVSVSCFYEF